MAFVGIKHLTPTFRQGALLARVSRMWDFRGGKDAQDIQHVDLVLIDPEGTAIYAEIGAANVETKKPLLVEGDIHVFRRFRVTESKPTYRPVESRYMVNITHLTLIDKCPDRAPDVPLYTYRLTKFLDLPSLFGEDKDFIEIGDAESVTFRYQPEPTRRRIITLRDFKYKPCYFATDGSTEVELVFFDEAGRRLIGKDVKQLIRTASNFGSIPSDIAAQIGQRYDLTVNVTNKAFLSCDYSYEVKWINHAYGREPRVPAIQTETSNEIATAARNVFEAGMSSTGDHVQNQKSQELPLGELDSPLNQPLQVFFLISQTIQT
ncbi:hypothetical protein PR202_ga08959 [Eleusine coracana subsp. coracana]|uniref:PLD phosphodiesterase domain-containing protein n=1 Tax=Eleusine coracana subsp. coracana TaxID=191504 RepID=A0AAV5C3Y8_ELECO|nr:hypothetical protein PR202_ga08959 [Eleusine coracana subsp. coracana]